MRRIEAIEMFGGHVPSRSALNVVQEAIRSGMNPTPYVNETIETAEAKGRNKIIVRPDNPLGKLKSHVMKRQAEGR